MPSDATTPDSQTSGSATPGSGRRTHAAGLFDIRNIIGALMVVYGLILTAMGLFADPEYDKTGGSNANLWAGLAMLALGAGFVLWARLRPVEVPEAGADDGQDG